jgi:tryptophanyl-tRNA synthetase
MSNSININKFLVNGIKLTLAVVSFFTFISSHHVFAGTPKVMTMALTGEPPNLDSSKATDSESFFIIGHTMDDPEIAKKKIMKAVTDSGSEILYADDKPALKNLINIYSLLGALSTEEVVARYAGKGYADFKRDLAEVVARFLVGFQEKFRAISDDEALRILHDGARKAREMASRKMREVREKVGFVSEMD